MNEQYSENVALATSFFDYAEKHGLALFPLRADTKTPACENGFYDATKNRAEWVDWQKQGHQLGISACLSGVVLIDVDAHGNRIEAWSHFIAWCKEIGIELPKHYGHSPGGGWHFAFRCPEAFDPAKFGGFRRIDISHFRPLAVGEEDHERISVRNRAYNVAPGSAFGGRPYLLATDAPAPHSYSEKTAALFDLLKRPETTSVTGPVPDAVDGVSHDGIRFEEFCWWVERKIERWTNGVESLSNNAWIDLGKRIKLSFPGADGLNAFLAMSWADQGDKIARRWWDERDFKTQGDNLVTLPAYLRNDVSWMFRHGLGCPRSTAPAVHCEIPAEILEQHKREREQYEATLLGPLPDHPELPIGQAEVLADFWAHLPSGRIIHAPSRGLWVSGSFDKHVGRIKDAMKVEGPGMLGSTFLSQHRHVHSMGWDPCEQMIIEGRILTENGWILTPRCRSFNTYLPPSIVPAEGDVSLWLNHVRFVYPNEADHIVKWLAYKVQHPGDKINHGLVFIGPPGIGKDTIVEPAIAAIGPHNFRSISGDRFFKSDFNGYLKSVLCRIDEVHDLGGESKYAFHDRTKTMLAAPPMANEINEKNVPHYTAVNVCGVILTSNHLDALYLPSDDRRHFVCISDRSKEDFDEGYFDKLYTWFESGGNEAVAHCLATLDLSTFKAKATPRRTAGWQMIVAAGMAPESGDMLDVIEVMGKKSADGKTIGPDVLTLDAIKLKAPVGSALRSMFDEAKTRRVIPKRLSDVGYVAVPNPDAPKDGRWRMPGGKVTIYGRRELTEGERLDAARLLIRNASLPPALPSGR